MTDIIKKIDAARAGMRDKYEIFTEARAEIERLTAENKRLKNFVIERFSSSALDNILAPAHTIKGEHSLLVTQREIDDWAKEDDSVSGKPK